MKAEDRILELLAEYLQKTDRILDRMEKSDRNFEAISRAILDHSAKFNEHNLKFNEHNVKFNEHSAKFNEHSAKFNEHSAKFNEHNVKFNEQNMKFNEHSVRFNKVHDQILRVEEKNQMLIEELISLSKRVSRIEDKN